MAIPLQITFRDIATTPAIEDNIRERAQRLERFSQHITSCHVVVETPHAHHHKGMLYHVRIDLAVPGEQLTVSRAPEQHHAHEDVYVAIRDAFDAATRRLADHVQRQRDAKKGAGVGKTTASTPLPTV